MAFVSPNEETPGPQAGQAAQQAPVASGGAGIGGSTKAAATPGVNVPAQPSAQLSAYLAANQPQSAAFGQNVAGQVAGQINAAGQAIPQAVNTYTGNLYSVPTDAATNAAVASSPSSLTAAQQATYQNELGAANAAPNSANTFETTQGYQDAASGVQNAVDQANLWSSGNNPSNIATALAPYEGPNATAGVRTLDSLLLSQSPGAYSQIQSAVAPAAGYQAQLASGTQNADAALQAAIAQDQATSTAAMAPASQYINGLNSTLAQYLSQAQNDAGTYNSAVNGLAGQEAAYQPSLATLKNAIDTYNQDVALGQGGGASSIFANLPNMSIGDPSAIPSTVGLPQIGALANQQNYSDISALQNLLGDSAFSSLNPSITPDMANLAGTYSAPTNNIPSIASLFQPVQTTGASSLSMAAPQVSALLGNVTPIKSDYTNAISAYNDLMTQLGLPTYSQTPNGQQPVTPPPPGAVGPQPGLNGAAGTPGNEAWYNYMQSTYPGLDGFTETYAQYLQNFGSTGIKPI